MSPLVPIIRAGPAYSEVGAQTSDVGACTYPPGYPAHAHAGSQTSDMGARTDTPGSNAKARSNGS